MRCGARLDEIFYIEDAAWQLLTILASLPRKTALLLQKPIGELLDQELGEWALGYKLIAPEERL